MSKITEEQIVRSYLGMLRAKVMMRDPPMFGDDTWRRDVLVHEELQGRYIDQLTVERRELSAAFKAKMGL